MSDELLRGFAPITPSAWQMIDQEASRVLQVHLTARRLIQTRGPLGWDHSAVNSGRATRLEEYGGSAVQTLVREVQPMLELRAPFELARDELESIGRGNPAPDLSPLTEAARNIAAAEDRLVYTGLASAFVRGMHSHSEHEPVALDGDYHNYPDAVALAFERLRRAGVGGPYAMALGTRCFSGLNTTTTVGGYPVLEHVRRIVDGPIIAVPVLDGESKAPLQNASVFVIDPSRLQSIASRILCARSFSKSVTLESGSSALKIVSIIFFTSMLSSAAPANLL